jgi:hypothetical protein
VESEVIQQFYPFKKQKSDPIIERNLSDEFDVSTEETITSDFLSWNISTPKYWIVFMRYNKDAKIEDLEVDKYGITYNVTIDPPDYFKSMEIIPELKDTKVVKDWGSSMTTKIFPIKIRSQFEIIIEDNKEYKFENISIDNIEYLMIKFKYTSEKTIPKIQFNYPLPNDENKEDN